MCYHPSRPPCWGAWPSSGKPPGRARPRAAGAPGCAGGCGCEACNCCPHCGCKLVPACQMTCVPKKTTEHEYCCKGKEICIPGATRPCDRCCDKCGECGGCDTCNDCGCGDGKCQCRVREIHKLMVHPYEKEHCVHACNVQWVCPNGCNCGCCEGGARPPRRRAWPRPPRRPAWPRPQRVRHHRCRAPPGCRRRRRLPPGPCRRIFTQRGRSIKPDRVV